MEVAVDDVSTDVCVKFGGTRETVFEIFEEFISCLTNEHDEAYPNSAKCLTSVSPKMIENRHAYSICCPPEVVTCDIILAVI